jgi:hypothetical protein
MGIGEGRRAVSARRPIFVTQDCGDGFYIQSERRRRGFFVYYAMQLDAPGGRVIRGRLQAEQSRRVDAVRQVEEWHMEDQSRTAVSQTAIAFAQAVVGAGPASRPYVNAAAYTGNDQYSAHFLSCWASCPAIPEV